MHFHKKGAILRFRPGWLKVKFKLDSNYEIHLSEMVRKGI